MNKNVLVTGAAGGLGIELVKKHIAEGDYVWALDLSMSEKMGDCLYADKETHHLCFLPCDISKTEKLEEAIRTAHMPLKDLDHIYSCAGICRVQDRVDLIDTDLDAISKVVDINAVGFLRVMKAVFTHITDHTTIICITSEAASITNNHRSQEFSYGMSKVAENMACVILQHYYKEKGMRTRILCMHPGWLKTQMGGGDMAEIDPRDSAQDLYNISKEINMIPEQIMFIDHKKNVIPW